ncbi:hypothetical protein D9613_001027 [Agrocybe pediades]|uniref:F-box domain-containing protein n=1 Tax=Agrocybe pediades TaxID=84607 RepID=A0A8H4VTC3_9AGAR|nr:hypothetical protein D9613_001027 [Agrocybe pediades]
MPPFLFHDLPLDILYPILAQLTERKDWHSCSLVNKVFARVATPFLYRTLDARKSWVHHPSTTLLRRPDLALYVRHVTETGAIHRGMQARNPNITTDTLAALSLCTNLRSMTWIDDSSSSEAILLAFLDVLRALPVRELTIRTHSDLSETVWTQLVSLTGLRKVSIWCMEGPPRALQGGQWSGPLGSTLTHLELGVSAFLYPCSELLAQLPLLRDLRLKGAPAASIPTILTYLPNLQSLDTEYLLSGSGFHQSKPSRTHQDDTAGPLGGGHQNPINTSNGVVLRHNHIRGAEEDNSIGSRSVGSATLPPTSLTIPQYNWYTHTNAHQQQPVQHLQGHHHHQHPHPNPHHHQQLPHQDDGEEVVVYEPVQHPPPALKHLTVRTRTLNGMGGTGPQKLWDWVQQLVPRPGLETFILHAFVYSTLPHSSSSSGNAAIPRKFILDMALAHGRTLKHFTVGDMFVSLEDVRFLGEMFPKLETLVCSTASPDVASIMRAISGAKNLQSLKLQVEWIPQKAAKRKWEEAGDGVYDADRTHFMGSRDEHIRQQVQYYNHDQDLRPLKQQRLSESLSPSPSPLLSPSSWISPYHYNACFSPQKAPLRLLPLPSSASSSASASPYSSPTTTPSLTIPPVRGSRCVESRFTLQDATSMMLRSEDSKLRSISIGHMQYTGKWMLQNPQEQSYENASDPNGTLAETKLKFVVTAKVAEDKWRT